MRNLDFTLRALGKLGFEAGIGDGRFCILESSLRFCLSDGEWIGVGQDWWCPGRRNEAWTRDVAVMDWRNIPVLDSTGHEV